MAKLTVFDDSGQAHAVKTEASAEAGPSRQTDDAKVFKRPQAPASHPSAGPSSPKRVKLADYGSDDEESSASSSSKKPAVNGVNGHLNGDAKGKGKAEPGLNKRQRKERAEALRTAREMLPVFKGKRRLSSVKFGS